MLDGKGRADRKVRPLCFVLAAHPSFNRNRVRFIPGVVDEVAINWPSGVTNTLTNVEAGQQITVSETPEELHGLA